MFYKFNSIVGRISPSSQMGAYAPQGLSATVAAPTPFIFDSSKTQVAKGPAAPAVSMTGVAATSEARGIVPSSAGYKKIMDLQKTFSVQDGLMVWQKLGSRDKLPYFATLALGVVGLGLTLNVIWTMSWPKKVEA